MERFLEVEPKQQIALECRCGEVTILLSHLEDWRSRRAAFRCECGEKIVSSLPISAGALTRFSEEVHDRTRRQEEPPSS